MAEARVMELERKVDTIMKGLNVLLFEEGEAFPSEEVEELKARLDDYLKGKALRVRDARRAADKCLAYSYTGRL